jgi:hypothetical protein
MPQKPIPSMQETLDRSVKVARNPERLSKPTIIQKDTLFTHMQSKPIKNLIEATGIHQVQSLKGEESISLSVQF